jgi:hypothetical protein
VALILIVTPRLVFVPLITVILFDGMLRDYVLNVLIFMAVFVSMSPKLFILLRH